MNEALREQMEANMAVLVELIELREKSKVSSSKKDKLKYDMAFDKAINRFSYIVDIHCGKYKKYPNYTDLHQEGLLGLTLALNNFNPQRSKNFFRIANWYVKTRIKRSANKYDVINVPMKVAKKSAYCRLSDVPVMVDNRNPHQSLECIQDSASIQAAMSNLTDLQRKVVSMYFDIQCADNTLGIQKTISFRTIAKEINTSTANVENALNEAYAILSKNDNVSCIL